MKKRILSALLAIMMVCQAASVVFARESEVLNITDGWIELADNSDFETPIGANGYKYVVGNAAQPQVGSTTAPAIKDLYVKDENGAWNYSIPVEDMEGRGKVAKLIPNSENDYKNSINTQFGLKRISNGTALDEIYLVGQAKGKLKFSVDVKAMDYTVIDRIAIGYRVNGMGDHIFNQDIRPKDNEWKTQTFEFDFAENTIVKEDGTYLKNLAGTKETKITQNASYFVVRVYYKVEDGNIPEGYFEKAGIYVDNLSVSTPEEPTYQVPGRNLFGTPVLTADAGKNTVTEETVDGKAAYKVTFNSATNSWGHWIDYTLAPQKLMNGRKYRVTASLKDGAGKVTGKSLTLRGTNSANGQSYKGDIKITADAVSDWQNFVYDITCDDTIADTKKLYFTITADVDQTAELYLADIKLELLPIENQYNIDILDGKTATVLNEVSESTGTYTVTPSSDITASDYAWRRLITYKFNALESAKDYKVSLKIKFPDEAYAGQTVRLRFGNSGTTSLTKKITAAANNDWETIVFDSAELSGGFSGVTLDGISICVSTTDALLAKESYSYQISDVKMECVGDPLEYTLSKTGNIAKVVINNTTSTGWNFEGLLIAAEYDTSNKLVQMVTKDVNVQLNSGKLAEEKVEFDRAVTEGNTVKVFLWEPALNQMQPIASAI